MNVLEYIRMAFQALRSNRMRSVLTMIGIIVGISSIVTIFTLGITIKDTVQNMIYYQSLNTFRVYMCGRPDVNPPRAEAADRIQYEWLQELSREYKDEFKPAVSVFYDYADSSNESGEKFTTNVYGVTEGFFQCNKKEITMGRELLQSDGERNKYTAVVADVFVRQYFGSGVNPLGKTVEINIKGSRIVKLTVVGVYKTNAYDFPGARSLLDKQTDIYIPYEVLESIAGNLRTVFSVVDIAGNKDIDREVLKEHLAEFFEKKYIARKYYYGEIDDIQKDAEATDKVVSMIIAVVAGIAAVSLIVAGIGVMNIMLVSISERTKEIGIRKALGATDGNVLLQFSLEAVSLCLIGGILGILFGIVNCNVLSKLVSRYSSSLGEYSKYIAKVVTIPSLATVLLAIGFACFVGICSGLYPATRAARMNPIDALRDE